MSTQLPPLFQICRHNATNPRKQYKSSGYGVFDNPKRLGEPCLFEHVADAQIDTATLEPMPVEAVAALRIFWGGGVYRNIFRGFFGDTAEAPPMKGCYFLVIKIWPHQQDTTQTSP